MRLYALATFCAALAFAAGPATAATHSFTLHNLTKRDVTGVSIPKGKIIGFKRIPASDSLTFSVEFPDGECRASRVRVKLFGGEIIDYDRYDVCSGEGITIVGN